MSDVNKNKGANMSSQAETAIQTHLDVIRRCCGRHRALIDERIVECPACSEDVPVPSDPLADRVACLCGESFKISETFDCDPHAVDAERKRQRGSYHFYLEYWGCDQ